MKRITKSWLKRQHACIEHRKLFIELYPNGIEVCWKCFQEAQRKGLDVSWLFYYVDQTTYREYARIIEQRPERTRTFPALSKRFCKHCEGEDNSWTIVLLPNQALRLLEKAFLEDNFDPLNLEL